MRQSQERCSHPGVPNPPRPGDEARAGRRSSGSTPVEERASRGEAQKTATLPESARGPWLEGPDLVIALREYNSDVEHLLAREQKAFMLGSAPDHDIAIPGAFLSSLHCVLERRGHRLRVRDQDSRNGTFFAGRREPTFDLGAGETFTVASTTFLAMNDEMRQVRPLFVDIVGADAAPSPDDLLVAAVRGTNLLITGAPDCDQDRLARGVHAVSLRRASAIVEVADLPTTRPAQRELIDRGARSTLVITLGAPAPRRDPRLDPAFASMLLSPSYRLRLILIAPTAAVATAALGSDAIGPMLHVPVRPLAARGGEILRLLDRALVEGGAALRVAELTPANQAALRAHPWPGNLAELRSTAARLDTLARVGTLRRAADALRMSKSTLHHWMDRLGLAQPLRARDPARPR